MAPATSDRTRTLVLLGLPGVVLGVAGLWHPMHLTAATADRWWMLHVAGLFVFPLVAVSLVSLVRGRRDPLAALVTVTAYVYATAYSALDVISGIAAGYVTSRLPAGAPRPDEVRSLFRIGTPLGHVGSVALVLAVLLLTADVVRRADGATGPALLAGAVATLGAVLLHFFHIYPPFGSAGIALVGIGTAGLGWARDRGRVPRRESS